MAQATPETEQLAADYLNIWNARAYSEIPAVVTESFVMYDPFAPEDEVPGPRGEVHGPDGLEAFIRGVVSGFPDFHVEVLTMLSSADTAMYDGQLSMTHEGVFFGIPPVGRSVTVRYMGMIRTADGQVDEHRVYPPLRDILEQLGFTFPAVIPLLPRLAWGKIKQLK